MNNQLKTVVENADEPPTMNDPALSILAKLYGLQSEFGHEYAMAIHHVEEHLIQYDPRFACECDNNIGMAEKRKDNSWVCHDCGSRYEIMNENTPTGSADD